MSARSIVDALTVGGGPAGLSAALAFARPNQTAVMFEKGKYRSAAADFMHLNLGWDHKPPSDFRSTARSQITQHYDAIRILENANIVAVKKTNEGTFQLSDENGKSWSGKKVIVERPKAAFPSVDDTDYWKRI